MRRLPSHHCSTMAFNLPGWNKSHSSQVENRYEDGPGAYLPDEFQPGAMAKNPRQKHDGVAIYIGNIKSSLTKSGVENLCRPFGRMLNVAREDGKRWAIVTFASFK